MNQYLLIDFLDKSGLFHEADIMDNYLIKEAKKQNFWPLLGPAAVAAGMLLPHSDNKHVPAPHPRSDLQITVDVTPGVQKSDFNEFLGLLNELEGGFSNRKHSFDPGGATMKGVTQHQYDEFRKFMREKGKKSVKQLTDNEKKEIYKQFYWKPANADKLPKYTALAIAQFDVLGGPAHQILQKIVGAPITGNIKDITLQKIHEYVKNDEFKDKELALKICDHQQRYLRNLPHYKYNHGWDARVEKVRNYIKQN